MRDDANLSYLRNRKTDGEDDEKKRTRRERHAMEKESRIDD